MASIRKTHPPLENRMFAARALTLGLFLALVAISPQARAQSASAYDMALPARSTAACDGPLCTLRGLERE